MYHIQELRRFDNDRAMFYAAEITCALQYLHGCSVVYRCPLIGLIVRLRRQSNGQRTALPRRGPGFTPRPGPNLIYGTFCPPSGAFWCDEQIVKRVVAIALRLPLLVWKPTRIHMTLPSRVLFRRFLGGNTPLKITNSPWAKIQEPFTSCNGPARQ